MAVLVARSGYVFRHFLPSHVQLMPRVTAQTLPGYSAHTRALYTPAALSLEQYLRQRHDAQAVFKGTGEGLKQRMSDLLKEQERATIFTVDFKNVLHLATDTELDLELVREMARRFNKQNEGLRFGMYVFGPVVMRTYHVLNKPQEALEALRDPELAGFFDQLMSYQVAMDLLLKGNKLQEVLELMDELQEKRLAGVRLPKGCLNLAIAACYKMNTQESLQKLLGLFKQMEEYGMSINRRLVVFGAALAINTGNPHLGLDLVLKSSTATHVCVRSLKVMALAHLGRIDEVIVAMRAITEVDIPGHYMSNRGSYIVKEAVETAEKAVMEGGRRDQQEEFKRIVKCLREAGAIVSKTIDQLACEPIARVEKGERQDTARLHASFRGRDARGAGTPRHPASHRRKGLMDME